MVVGAWQEAEGINLVFPLDSVVIVVLPAGSDQRVGGGWREQPPSLVVAT